MAIYPAGRVYRPPGSLSVVERILAATQQALKDLMGNSSELRNLSV